MITVGVTGSIAMGKSEVAKIFRAHALPVFDSDAEVHALYESKEGAELLERLAPAAIVGGRVDRAKLTALVLSDTTLLEKLETVVHAAIARRRAMFLKQSENAGHAIAVIDVPLLFEKSIDKEMDVTIVVSAPPHKQRDRALARPGMTESKLEMILKRQMPDQEKRQRADIIIENDGSLEDLKDRTEAVIHQLRENQTS
jgi:dephospho-CoA kinase